MARSFNGSTDYAEVGSAVVDAPAFTIACWAKSTDATATQVAVSLASTANSSLLNLGFNGASAGDPAFLFVRNSTSSSSQNTNTATGYTAGRWHHLCAVCAASNDRTVYLDGGNSGSGSTSVSFSGLNLTTVGARYLSGSYGQGLKGSAAEVGIWNVALTASEIAALASGVSPLRIRRAALVFYAPLLGAGSPEPDYSGHGYALTLTGTSVAAHAPVAPMFAAVGGWPGAFGAAAGGLMPAAMAVAWTVGSVTRTATRQLSPGASASVWTIATPTIAASLTRAASVATSPWVVPVASMLGNQTIQAAVGTAQWTVPAAALDRQVISPAATATWTAPGVTLDKTLTLSPASSSELWGVPAVTITGGEQTESSIDLFQSFGWHKLTKRES